MGLLLGGIYALISIGLNLIFGVIRIVNFAHGEVVMVSMYLTYFCVTHLGIGVYTAILLVAPAMFVFGVLIQRLLIQPLQDEPMMQIFATFGLMIFLENVMLIVTRGEALGLPNATVGSVSLAGISVSGARVAAFLAVSAVAVGLQLFLHHTMMGKAIRAVTQDKRAAATMGINVKGAFLFMSDLARRIDLPVELDFMAVSSYGSATKTSGVVRIIKDLDTDLTDRHVLIVEDIVDSGLTLAYLRKNLAARNPASLEVCSLLVKEGLQKVDPDLRYVGFRIPPVFVVGYGLDVDERYRNLPYVCEYAEPGV